MAAIVRIDGQTIDIEDFVKTLKLTGQFESLLEQLVRDRITVLAAKKRGIPLSPDEVQERADQFRRIQGLHRAADMNNYLDAIGVSLDEFEAFVTDSLYQEKMMDEVCSDAAVAEYFHLHSPKFDSMEVSHILVDSEGKAREIIAYLEDDPDGFADMAAEHSLAETREHGGVIGKVLRGALRGDIEARVFNADDGEVLGPFATPDHSLFEIFRIDARRPAALDEDTAAEVRRLVREEWLLARAQEHLIETR